MDLVKEIEDTLAQINIQLERLRQTAHELGIPVSQLQDKFGRYMITDLLITKGQLLHALALAKA